MKDPFHRRMEEVQAGIERLLSARAAEEQDPRLQEVLQQLSIGLEELQVSAEEIRQQQEELAAAHAVVDIERRRYRTLFEEAPDPYVVTDTYGRIQAANLRAAELLGVPRGDVAGKSLRSFVDPAGQRTYSRLLGVLRSRARVEDELLPVRPRSRDGEPLWVSCTVVHALGEGAEPVLRWMLRDVTEPRRLLERLAYQAGALAQVADAVIAMDADGTVTYVNRRVVEQYGVAEDEAVGRPLEALYRTEWGTPGGRDAALAAVHDMGYWRGSAVHVTRDGRRIPVDATLIELHGPEGEPHGMLATIHDVSDEQHAAAERERLLVETKKERKRAEGLAVDLARERDILGTIMANTSAQLAYLDREFRFIRVNDAYVRGSGHSQGELLGRDHFELFPNEENREIFSRVRDTGEPVRFAAKPFRFADQPERGVTYWDWTLVPVKDGSGEVTGLVFSLLDVTEAEHARQAREAHLASLQQMLGVSQRVLAESSVEGVLQEAARAARDLTGARAARVCRWSDATGGQELATTTGAHSPPGGDGGPVRGVAGALCRRLAGPAGPAAERRGARAAAVRLDLGAKGDRGAIVALGKAEGEFGAEDEAILGQLASLTCLALAHIRATRQAERRAEEREAVFGALTDAVFVYNADGDIIGCNAAAEAALGYSPVGRSRRVIVSQIALRLSDNAPVPFSELPSSRALRGETVHGERYRYNGPQDAVLALLISAAPFVLDGQVAGAVVVWHDVTEREQLLDALRAEQARLHAVIDHAPVGIVVADARARIVLVNRFAERVFARPLPYGEPSTEVLGTRLLHPAGGAPVGADHPLVRAAMDGDTTRNEELLLPLPGGRYRHLLHHAAPVRLPPEGEIDGAVLVFQDITEQRQAEEALHRRQEEFRALVENAPDIVARLDRDLRYTYVNPVVERYLGASPDELVGQGVGELGIEGEVVALLEEAIAEVFGSGSERTLEYALNVGSERLFMEARLSPEFSQDGTVHSVLSVTRDITERHRARQALGRYALRLQVLHMLDRAILAARSVEDIAHAAIEAVRDIVPYRRSSVLLFDLAADEVILHAQLVAEADGPELQVLREGARLPMSAVWFRDVLERGETYLVDDLQEVTASSVALDDLRAIGIRAYASLPLITQGELIGALTLGMSTPGALGGEALDVGREVADELAIGVRQAQLDAQVRRHAQALEQTVARRTAALRESEERFRAVYEEAGLGIAIVDEGGVVRDANPALRQMLGYAAAELVGRPLASLEYLDERGEAPDPDAFRRMVGEADGHVRQEKQYRRKDGRRLWVDQIVTVVRLSARRAPFAIALLDDVTERKRMLAALRQNERLVMSGRMAATVAHEINNPLQAVIGCLGLARELVGDAVPEALRYLDVGRDELLNAARIVGRLRDVYRPFRPEDREPTDLNTLVEQALEITRRKRDEQGIALALDAGALPLVPLIPDRIQQVIINLVLNAVEAMANGGRLTLRTRTTSDPPGVRLDVADTGKGIPVEGLPLIFDMFYTSKVDGLGLGLYITQGIVEEHGGHIEVQSEVGKGTSVAVWLPQ